MKPRPPSPPGVDELVLVHPGKNGKTAFQILFIVAAVVAGAAMTGKGYYPIMIGSACLLSIPYNGRWKTEDSVRRIVILSVVWPATVLISWYIIMNEERWRKERIVYEVMET
jgi:hypothetical protein